MSSLSLRADALAVRLEQGARDLAGFASTLTDAEWQTRVAKDGRKIGVVVHHVATMYPLEIQLAQTLAGGKPVAGVTWDAVHEINARHAREHDAVTKDAALNLLQRNSTAAAAAIRALSDQELDRAAAVSLNSDAPLTCQFMPRRPAQLSPPRPYSGGVDAVTMCPERVRKTFCGRQRGAFVVL